MVPDLGPRDPGNCSRPFRTDNAVVKAAKVVQRIASISPEPVIVPAWEQSIKGDWGGQDWLDVSTAAQRAA
jgi:hypothetical protein